MPCNTISTYTLDIGKLDSTLANKALNEVPELSGRVYYSKGQLVSRGFNLTAEHQQQFKRAYSAETVKSTAARLGWQVKETAPFKYQIIKR